MKTRTSLFDILNLPEAAGLAAGDKLVLLYLSWRQGHNGVSWPSLKTIGADLHIDGRNVRRAIERLCKAGCIQKTSGQCGRGHSNRYTILLDKTGQGTPISVEPKEGDQPPFQREKRGRSVQEKGAIRPLKEQGSNQKKKRRTARTARAAFIPPTVDEVQTYAESRGVPDFDAARFMEHYEPRGWTKVNGKPVLDWKATVRTWIEKDNERRVERGEPPEDGYSQFNTQPVSIEAAMAALEG